MRNVQNGQLGRTRVDFEELALKIAPFSCFFVSRMRVFKSSFPPKGIGDTQVS
jgi:hypothetical protein